MDGDGGEYVGLLDDGVPRRQSNRGRLAPMTYSVVLSLLFALIGVVTWIEGGPHPRTWAAWLLLVTILIVSALPVLLCWLFC